MNLAACVTLRRKCWADWYVGSRTSSRLSQHVTSRISMS